MQVFAGGSGDRVLLTPQGGDELTNQELLAEALADALRARVTHGVLGVAEPGAVQVLEQARSLAALVDDLDERAARTVAVARAAYVSTIADLDGAGVAA